MITQAIENEDYNEIDLSAEFAALKIATEPPLTVIHHPTVIPSLPQSSPPVRDNQKEALANLAIYLGAAICTLSVLAGFLANAYNSTADQSTLTPDELSTMQVVFNCLKMAITGVVVTYMTVNSYKTSTSEIRTQLATLRQKKRPSIKGVTYALLSGSLALTMADDSYHAIRTFIADSPWLAGTLATPAFLTLAVYAFNRLNDTHTRIYNSWSYDNDPRKAFTDHLLRINKKHAAQVELLLDEVKNDLFANEPDTHLTSERFNALVVKLADKLFTYSESNPDLFDEPSMPSYIATYIYNATTTISFATAASIVFSMKGFRQADVITSSDFLKIPYGLLTGVSGGMFISTAGVDLRQTAAMSYTHLLTHKRYLPIVALSMIFGSLAATSIQGLAKDVFLDANKLIDIDPGSTAASLLGGLLTSAAACVFTNASLAYQPRQKLFTLFSRLRPNPSKPEELRVPVLARLVEQRPITRDTADAIRQITIRTKKTRIEQDVANESGSDDDVLLRRRM